MPPTTRSAPRSGMRLAAVALAPVLLLSACGGGDSTGGPSPSASSTSPTASATPSAPAGVETTAAGTQLAFGDTATVVHTAKLGKGKGSPAGATVSTALDLTVDSAQQGVLADLSGFNLTDPYQRKANYFYVRVTVENTGKEVLGGIEVPLWGVSGENTLLPPVRFTSAFSKCPTEPLPEKFGRGDTFKTCLVFLSPDHGSLAGVSYRPTEDFDPIEWHGPVAEPPKPKKKDKPAKKG